MKKLVILDYGMGNLRSVQNALQSLRYPAVISNERKTIESADAYILPGVGAFPRAMENLTKLGLVDVLSEQVLSKKKPILGICLGMQLFAESSTELGVSEGLGWLPAKVVKLEVDEELAVPHVGWNQIQIERDGGFFKNIVSGSHFYFDHSYHFISDSEFVAASTQYGRKIVAAIRMGNIFATQFHPEKSQNAGLKLIRNFLNVIEVPTC